MQTSSRPAGGRGLEDAVEQRDDRLAALEGEPLLADVLGLQERLERLGGVEPAQDAQLLRAVGLRVRALDPRLDPLALLGVLDVHVLDADGAAVGVAQDAEDVAQPGERRAAEARRSANSRSRSHSVSPWLITSRSGCVRCAVLQRVGVGHQVAAHAVGVDQLLHARGSCRCRRRARRGCRGPADRLVGQRAGAREDVVVEAVVAQQQLVDDPQELPGLRALDDPVVVGRRQRHDLADRPAGRASRGARPGTPRGTPSRRHRRSCPGPAISRGTEWTVPIVPGLVRLIVVPAKSSTVSLLARALRTRSS